MPAAPLARPSHRPARTEPIGLLDRAAQPLARLYHGGSPEWRRELKRKLFHQLTLMYLAAYAFIDRPHMLPLLGGWVSLIAAIEIFRLKSKRGKELAQKFFGGIIRAKEANRFSGAFYVSLGVFLTIALNGSMPPAVAAGILMLSLGDAVSPLVGMRLGIKPFTVAGTRRSLDGLAAGFAAAFLIGLATGFTPLVALGGAAAFSAVDTYPVKPDDNLWIPIVGATVLRLLSGI